METKIVTRSKILKVLIILMYHLIRVLVPLAIILGIRIEALRVSWVAYGRDDGPGSPTADDVVPVDGAEEGVGFDAAGAAGDVAEAAGAVDCAEGADDVFCFGGYGGVLWECYWFFDDSSYC